jgi:VWFA-related protein
MRAVQLRTAVVAIITTGCLCAQQAGPPAPSADTPLILRATTRLVMLSVIARDKNGQPAADLKKEDFRVKVNGKAQPIAVFSMESAGQLLSTAVSAPATVSTLAFGPNPLPGGAALPANVFSNRLAVQSGTPSGVTIILVDTRNTKATDQIYAKAQVIRYLHTLQPTDHIGIYMFGASLKVLHDYTSDSSALIAKLNAAKNWEAVDTSEQDVTSSLQADSAILDGFARAAGGTSPAERAFYTTDRILSTLRTFEFIAEHLAQVPGRKNLIWVSGGFPLDIGFDSLADWKNPAVDQRTFTDEVDRTMRAMNDANIAVYPVDARGLMTDPKYSAENRTAPNPRKVSFAPPIGAKEQETMQEIAGRTGGLAFYNTNDLSRAIRASVDDSQVTYTIGFYPSDDGFDGKYHKIEVETRSGVKLRYRKGYFDVAEKPQDDKSRQAELYDAVWSPIDASAMGIVATVRPAANDPTSIDISLKIDHSTIGVQQGQGRWQGRLDVLFVQRDDQGNQYGGTDDTINLNLTPDTYKKLMNDDLAYHRVVARAAAAKLLRIVVRDAASGAMGSVTVPLNRVK